MGIIIVATFDYYYLFSHLVVSLYHCVEYSLVFRLYIYLYLCIYILLHTFSLSMILYIYRNMTASTKELTTASAEEVADSDSDCPELVDEEDGPILAAEIVTNTNAPPSNNNNNKNNSNNNSNNNSETKNEITRTNVSS